MTLLQQSMLGMSGILLDRALSLDFQLEKGFTMSLDDIPADEYNVLRLLQIERNRHEQEQIDKAKRNGK